MFAILVTGLYQDLKNVKPDGTKGGILLNYLSSRIFYHDVTRSALESECIRCGIENKTIQNNIWFDESYGWKTLGTFNVYLRINFLKKTNIKKYLTGYFRISLKQIECLTLDPNSMIQTKVIQYLNDLHTKYDADCGQSCTQGEFAIIQWGQNGITDAVDKVIFSKKILIFFLRHNTSKVT